MTGGEGGIRTHGRVTPTAVFETARFGRSRTSPLWQIVGWVDYRADEEYMPDGCAELTVVDAVLQWLLLVRILSQTRRSAFSLNTLRSSTIANVSRAQ